MKTYNLGLDVIGADAVTEATMADRFNKAQRGKSYESAPAASGGMSIGFILATAGIGIAALILWPHLRKVL